MRRTRVLCQRLRSQCASCRGARQGQDTVPPQHQLQMGLNIYLHLICRRRGVPARPLAQHAADRYGRPFERESRRSDRDRDYSRLSPRSRERGRRSDRDQDDGRQPSREHGRDGGTEQLPSASSWQPHHRHPSRNGRPLGHSRCSGAFFVFCFFGFGCSNASQKPRLGSQGRRSRCLAFCTQVRGASGH